MLRLNLKNTFLEVGLAEGEEEGKEPAAWSSGSAWGSPEARRRTSPQCSPASIRSRSAEVCSPSQGQADCPQLARLNRLLVSRARPSFALDDVATDAPDPPPCEESGAGWGAASITTSDEALADSGSSFRATSSTASACTTPRRQKTAQCPTGSTTPSASDYGVREYCHKLVPRTIDLEKRAKAVGEDEEAPPTTLMIRNVPNCYSQRELMAELDQLGLTGTFNFLYMPQDKSSKASVGYAFVNFTTAASAADCWSALEGHAFTQHGKRREAKVSVAHLQGLEANLAHYESCASKSAKESLHRPLLLTA